MLEFHWNRHLWNGFNRTQWVKQQQTEGSGDTSLSSFTDYQRLRQTCVQPDINIINNLTLGTNGTVLMAQIIPGWALEFPGFTTEATDFSLKWRGQPSTSSTMIILTVLLIMCLGIPARSGVTFTAVKHKSTKRVQVNVANMNICNGVNANFSCLLDQKLWSVNAEMINGVRLRLKLENLLTYLRNKSCTWHVISLLSLKGSVWRLTKL